MKKLTSVMPGRAARIYLRIALPIVMLSLIALLIAYLDARRLDPVGANYYYPLLLEYPVAGLTITAAGTTLIEYITRVGKRK